MGLFPGKKKDATPPAPVRRDKVIAMIKADLDREDAIDREDDRAWQRAKDAGDKAYRGATKAEIKAASEGFDRATSTRWFR
ncbi:hypothetical protein [Nonomuraea ceibae]|uniref:hypothetical protein n=1 Tax=Nonomuraea ceibae TaxID=1935170 RepID=UPI001C5FC305|nr:hypothetical protein [Nonomuraea ceibae]